MEGIKKILVTGGAGFIGTHTCVALLEKGYSLIVYDSFVNSKKKSLDKVIEIVSKKKSKEKINLKIVEGDIRDKDKLYKTFFDAKNNKSPINAVLHFAGLKAVGESVIDPLKYWDVNVNGSLNLFNIMSQFNCKTIVFSSSATIYGTSSNLIKESNLISPINPYGKTKYSIEIILRDLYESQKDSWRIINLRYFNPIGAHFSGLIGESPYGKPNNIFPYITQVASRNLEKLSIFGIDWPTPDGTGVRDYIHVMDLAEGHLQALEYISANKPQYLSLNLGTGKGTSVLELVNIFQEVNNITIPYIFTDRRRGDAGIVVADNSLCKKVLSWEPKKNIGEMCRDGFNWQLKNPKGY